LSNDASIERYNASLCQPYDGGDFFFAVTFLKKFP